MLEMVVVVSIMAILGASLISGYATMERTQRLNNSAEKVMNMLHQARSLAISNNCVYHVRFQDGLWNGAIDPMTQRPKYDDQMILLFRYSTTAEAVSVRNVADMGPGPNAASPNSYTPKEAQKHYDEKMAQAAALDATNPTQAEIIRTQATSAYINPATGGVYNNQRVDQIKLDQTCFLGLQTPAGTTAPTDRVIFFYPDGTASENISVFVTDLINNKIIYDPGTPPLPRPARTALDDFRDDRMNSLTYAARNDARAEAHRTQSQNIRMVQVMRGGMIKLLRPEVAP